MMDKIFVYMCLRIASIKSTGGNKTRLFFRAFLVWTSVFLRLAEALRNDYVTACSTALRSGTEKKELAGYVTVRCPSKTTKRSSTADSINF